MFIPFGGSAQKPEPIDINVKVILIGDRLPLRIALRV